MYSCGAGSYGYMDQIKALRPMRNTRRFAEDSVKLIFLHENCFILVWTSLKFVSKGPLMA